MESRKHLEPSQLVDRIVLPTLRTSGLTDELLELGWCRVPAHEGQHVETFKLVPYRVTATAGGNCVCVQPFETADSEVTSGLIPVGRILPVEDAIQDYLAELQDPGLGAELIYYALGMGFELLDDFPAAISAFSSCVDLAVHNETDFVRGKGLVGRERLWRKLGHHEFADRDASGASKIASKMKNPFDSPFSCEPFLLLGHTIHRC